MAPELTDNEQDRSKVFFVCTLFVGIGSIFATAMPVMGQLFFAAVRGVEQSSCVNPDEYVYALFPVI